MEYIDVRWAQSNTGYPIRIVSALDEQRYEIRKMEFFSDGRFGFAETGMNFNGTALGDAPVPPIAEINSDSQFSAVAITEDEFKDLWRQYASKS